MTTLSIPTSPRTAGKPRQRPPKPPPPPFSGVTLQDAIEYLQSHVSEGAGCPCCKQLAKIYRRTITTSMAYALILIHLHYEGYPVGPIAAPAERPDPMSWLHVPRFLSKASRVAAAVRGGDWAKLRFWGLLISKEDEDRDDGSGRVGLWRISPLGHQFAKGEIEVPRTALLYNQGLVRLDDTRKITIRDALGKQFHYDDLMRGVA